ncbi:MAG TPA: histidine kinase dimerization/phospho-acceptor domain-containing protein [Candidatus Binataceae bacterium]|jgi:signal transduction histidine kinase|nr:histidine kinase dimerization/phospho-acceptor domain-containing protein [Candidatus Binataceae bacterium]
MNLFESLIERLAHADAGVVVLNGAGLILSANASARQMLFADGPNPAGRTFSDALGKNHPLIKLVEELSAHTAAAAPIAEAVWHRDAGPFLLTICRFDEATATDRRLVVVVRDLAPALELLGEARSGYDASELLTRLREMTHQMRGPLQAMKFRLELMSAEPGGDPTRHIARMRDEVGRIDQAIDALLQLFKAGAKPTSAPR